MTLQQLKYAVCTAECKSMNKAASKLFISQPSLSGTIRDLEEEIGMKIFSRSNRGITITPEGEDFLGYARQILQQYQLMEEKFIEKKKPKQKFSVSMQHYTFAVQAFIEMAKDFGMDDFEFAVHETKTHEVIENVRNQKSEIGILYLNDFNRQVMEKIFQENAVEFTELFDCGIYVFLWKGNPLAQKELIEFEDLKDYPCLSFEQGDENSFYFAEEVFSTYDYKQIIKTDDRATILNLMIGLNGYTLCSGIICNDLNGNEYAAVPLHTDEKMHIGYIKKKGMPLSRLGERYISELRKFEKNIL
ncbi:MULTISPECIES: LysR family transcriptional regulator [Anaerostipes]|uniref:LysR family transcriptional regulator n=2 Tax=Anaerostipes TaxID=207244 RepID=A0A916QDE5_9FIRM|nr:MULTISPECIES: LysR family transcriptional regulator [Anaerostipes]GFO86613.1 LysR family transcriptional regulator [Anaerostipes butyraticus]HJC50239.1 LysR family transcriptional regulator [Candidatus Anaerostipes avistercoris]